MKTTFLLLLFPGLMAASDQRGIEELSRCVKMAEPLMKDPENIFPLSNRDIDRVCKMWDGFVQCVEDYTLSFLSPSQRQELNAAIESSVKSIKQLCVEDPEYRRSYIANAPCMKRVFTNRTLCGGQYEYLADLVQGLQATDAQMCCAHHKFRDCVLERTAPECDQPAGLLLLHQGPASRFMRAMLDRAMGFLLQKCKDFVPNVRDCPRGSPDPPPSPADDNHNNHNPHNHNNHLLPDATTPHASPPPTRFTWTTSAGPTTPGPAGNGLLGAESQQYRGAVARATPGHAFVALCAAVALALCRD